jgi:hypothetical protein
LRGGKDAKKRRASSWERQDRSNRRARTSESFQAYQGSQSSALGSSSESEREDGCDDVSSAPGDEDLYSVMPRDDLVEVPQVDVKVFAVWDELERYMRIYSKRTFQVSGTVLQFQTGYTLSDCGRDLR